MLAKTQFPDVNILQLAFFGAWRAGAIGERHVISDKFGGVRVTLINFIFYGAVYRLCYSSRCEAPAQAALARSILFLWACF